MEERLKQRLVGAVVLVSLAVVFVPLLFDMPREANEGKSATGVSEIPERPQKQSGSTVSIALDLPQTLRVDAEVERERNRNAPAGEDEYSGTVSNDIASASADSDNIAVDVTSNSSSASGSEKVPNDTPAKSSASTSEASITTRSSDDGTENRQAGVARASGGWMIQLGSFQKPENALALRKRLQSKGFPAFIESGSSAQGAVSRVFVGPMPDRRQAKASAAKLQREMALEGIVLRSPGG